jgi:hypothetical protein
MNTVMNMMRVALMVQRVGQTQASEPREHVLELVGDITVQALAASRLSINAVSTP